MVFFSAVVCDAGGFSPVITIAMGAISLPLLLKHCQLSVRIYVISTRPANKSVVSNQSK